MRNKINDLIIVLLESDDFLAAHELAGLLDVSKRTVYNYLNSPIFLNKIESGELVKIQNRGIRLKVNKEQKRFILKRIHQELPVQKHVVSDFISILFLLLNSKNYIRLNDLSDELFMSSSNIMNIIKSIDEYVSSFACHIEVKKSHGIKLVGEEGNIRSLYQFLLLNDFDSMNSDVTISHKRLNQTASTSLSYLLEEKDAQTIIGFVEYIETLQSTHFSDIDFNLFIIQLLIIIKRNQIGNRLINQKQLQLINSQEYLYATLLNAKIEEHFYITLSEDEINALALIILSLRKQEYSLPLNYELNIIDKFMERVGKKINVELKESKDLRQSLLVHLRPAIHRLKHGITSHNLLLEKIKYEFTDVYIAVMTTIDDLEREENIYFDENEIGFICLHIIGALSNLKEHTDALKAALICNEGLSVEIFIKNMITNRFNNIRIDSIYNSANLDDVNKGQFELIINTTSHKLDLINEVVVSPQLTIEDFRAIDTFLDQHSNKHNLEIVKTQLLSYFKDDVSSQKELLEKYSNYLYENGYVNEHYYASVLDRMKINDTYVARGIAVPHGLPENVLESIILVIILDEPIDWGENKVQIVLFFVSDNEHPQEFNFLLRKLLRVASSNEKTERLLNSKNEEEVYNVISRA